MSLSATLYIVLVLTRPKQIRYTLWNVVETLTMVEEPQNTFLVREEKAPRPAETDALTEEVIETEVTMVKAKPITSKIKTTIKHLQSRAGFRARWRGLSLFVVYGFAHSILSGFILTIYGVVAPGQVHGMHAIASILTSIALARYATAWVHIVISEPSSKPWYRRIPSLKTWRNVWAPTAIAAITTRIALFLPVLCGRILGIDIVNGFYQAPELPIVAGKVLVCALLGLLSFVVLVIPAMVSLVRVQASMLPEEDESIVPFDRTFGGRVVPEVLGGSGCIKFLDAWKTFDMAARGRIVKMYAKFILIEIGLHMFLVLALGIQALVLIGPANIRRIMEDSKL